jgi:hypothetical protein
MNEVAAQDDHRLRNGSCGFLSSKHAWLCTHGNGDTVTLLFQFTRLSVAILPLPVVTFTFTTTATGAKHCEMSPLIRSILSVESLNGL